jgi:cytochrome c-type biogenesis protein CcmE
MSSSAEPASSRPRRPASARGGIPFGYVVVGLVVIGIGILIVATVTGGRYELEVGQVATASASFHEKNVRVRGQIKEGSIATGVVEGRPMTRFTIVDENGHELRVVSRESPPDNFEGGKSCIVEGRYSDTDGVVESTRLTMKCPSKYEAEGNRPKTSDDLYERYRKAPAPAAQGAAPRS